MNNIFDINDREGKEIRLTDKQWKHILRRHSYMEKYLEEIKETLKDPDKLIKQPFEKGYYYKSYKYLKKPNKFILVIVKYLNGEGFVITSYLKK
jgi:hypothetical protein